MADWKNLKTDSGASFDRLVEIDAADIEPSVTWGIHPGMVIGIGGTVPGGEADALGYMRFEAGQSLVSEPVALLFIVSCTTPFSALVGIDAAIFRGRNEGILSSALKVGDEQPGTMHPCEGMIGQQFGIIYLHANDAVRANKRALAALDADVRFPYRNKH